MRYTLLLCFLLVSTASEAQFWADSSEAFEWSVDVVHATESGAVLAGTSDAIYRSTDQGQTWSKVLDDDGQQITSEGGAIYVASLGGLYRSSDDGRSWEWIMQAGAWSVSVQDDYVAAGGTGGQYYYSTDGGNTWTVPSWPWMPEGYDGSVIAVHVDSERLMHVHGFSEMFRSVDGGASWTRARARAPDFFVRSGDGRILINHSGSIESSTDGQSWSTVGDTPFLGINQLDVSGDRMVVASLWGVAVSSDGGQTWRDWSGKLEDANWTSIDPDGYVYAASGKKVYRSAEPIGDGGTSTAKASVAELPSEHQLMQPYPNPFNPVVRIPFVLARPDEVRLSVYDATGRLVGEVFSGRLPAGSYRMPLLGDGMPSGTYVVELTAGERVFTRKVTLAK